MARTELESKKQKRKAKKRKHASSDDEVANKSLIVDQQPDQTETQVEEGQVPRKDKASKRKQQQEISAVKEKRSKQTKESKDDAEEDNEELGEGENLPTAELLEEAAKPENVNAIVTVRQKKKQKHLKRLEAQKDQSADKEAKRNEEYLKKWKDNRKEWKFEKLRQISIQQTAFDEQKLSEEVWPIALEYLASSKGAAKTMLTKLAEDVIQELDTKCDQLGEDTERKTIVESVRYQRARNLLQSFD